MIRIRLQRRGRRKRPIHHIVVADSRAPRDGRIIEDLGRFDNITPQNQVTLNEERAIYWIRQGAQPTDTVRSILKNEGILYKIHLINWGRSEEEIEQALAEWREARESKAAGKVQSRKEKQKALLEAEEKEYQKQLKKKAEEAAKQKSKEEALASGQEEAEAESTAGTAETEGAAGEETTASGAEAAEAPAETETTEADASEPEVKKEAEIKPPAEEASQAEAEEPDTAGEPEVQKEAEVEAAPEGTAEAETAGEKDETEKTGADDAEAEKAEERSGGQVSTAMTAKEAIDHIKNTDLDKLKGFVPDDEDRVTVRRAWESKQEE